MATKKVETKENAEKKVTPKKNTTTVKKEVTKTTTKKATPKKTVQTKTKKAAPKTVVSKVNEEKVKKAVKTEIVEEVKSDSKLETVKESKKAKNGKGKKILLFIIFILVLVIAGLLVYLFVFNNKGGSNKPKDPNEIKLPKPEVEDGERGKLGIDKNVNEKTIDKYLGRKDAVYRDMRMLEDPALYEEIGGDRFLSGYVKGFEVVPLPYIIPVDDLPKEVGRTYDGNTLFFKKSDGSYVPLYEESMDVIEDLFPKNKVIFLMCGGGGYAGMMKQFLVANGWNEDKIYVVGGYWYYNGKNKVDVPKKRTGEYDFSDVPYHDIDFADLTRVKTNRHNSGDIKKFYLDGEYYEGKDETFDKLVLEYTSLYSNFFSGKDFDKMTDEEYDKLLDEYNELEDKKTKELAGYINDLLNDKKSFVIGVYSDSGCMNPKTSVSHLAIDYASENNVYFYEVPSSILFECDLYADVQEFPNVIIIKDGKAYTFLDYSSEEDEKIFESKDELIKWINKYIYMKR